MIKILFYLYKFVHLLCSRCHKCKCKTHLCYNMLHCCHTGDLKNTRRYLQTYIHTFYFYFEIEVQCPRVAMLIYNHGQKSWDTLHFWGVSNSNRSNPFPHARNNVGRVYPEFFPSFNFVWSGGRKNCKKISNRTAVLYQGLLSRIVWILVLGKKSVFSFFLRLSGILVLLAR